MADIDAAAAFLAGLVSFFSPCTFPLLPAFFGMLGARADGRGSRWWLLLNGAAFVLGLGLVYTSLGATATVIGGALSKNARTIRFFAGIMVALLGLFQSGLIKLPFLQRELKFKPLHKGGLFASAVTGAAFAFGWSPCTGPQLAMVLLMASAKGTAAAGIRLLALYSLGMGIPYILIAGFAGTIYKKLSGHGKYLVWVRAVSGALMMAMGLLLMTGVLSL